MLKLARFLVAVGAVLAVAVAVPARASSCLAIPAARTLIQGGKIIPLMRAVQMARASAKGDVIDSRLCGVGKSYQYRVTFLGADGRVFRVSVDANSGKVLGVK